MKNYRMKVAFIGFLLLLLSLCSCTDQDDDDDADTDDDDDNDDDDDYEITEGFVFIPAGEFTMGSDADYACAINETPRHVTLTHDFEIMTTEATQEKFETIMDYNPSYNADCTDCPVENVSWYSALVFANMLSMQEGYQPCFVFSEVECFDASGNDYVCPDGGRIHLAKISLNSASTVYDCEGYRLPTEAEWEYAIRAGTSTDFYNGDISEFECYYLDPILDEIAWYCGNADDFTRPVAQKLPNNWGLYDMSGNVSEWVWDIYENYNDNDENPWGDIPEETDYVSNRGGSFNGDACKCRSATRRKSNPRRFDLAGGFRLVRTLN